DGEDRARDHGRQGTLLHLPHGGQVGSPAFPGPRGHRQPGRKPRPRPLRRRVHGPVHVRAQQVHRPRIQPRHAGDQQAADRLDRRRDPGGDRLSPDPRRQDDRDHADEAPVAGGRHRRGGRLRRADRGPRTRCRDSRRRRAPRRRPPARRTPSPTRSPNPRRPSHPRHRGPANERGTPQGDDAMTLPIVWWVALLLLAVQLVLWKRRTGTFFWTLVSWFSIFLFLRYGFTVPISKSVVMLYMGITTLATLAYVTSDRGRLQGFTSPLVRLCTEPRLRPLLLAVVLGLP